MTRDRTAECEQRGGAVYTAPCLSVSGDMCGSLGVVECVLIGDFVVGYCVVGSCVSVWGPYKTGSMGMVCGVVLSLAPGGVV